MIKKFDQDTAEFIEKHPTCFHVIAGQKTMLEEAGFHQLLEMEDWELQAGGKYFVLRNDSAIIAFRIPKGEWKGYSITASHCDSPCLKIKENPEMKDGKYIRLNVEAYGGAILSTWFDKPLSVAGRLSINENGTLKNELVDMEEDMLVIPNLAIHMNRQVNDGYKYNVQKDLLPLYGKADADAFMGKIAARVGVEKEQILSSDLFVYNRQPFSFWGGEFMSGPRIDDCMCAYASLRGLLESEPEEKTAVHVVYDNEEVGSSTKQGAASTFLKDVLTRISISFHEGNSSYIKDVADSFMLSADNAHGIHPNYPEKCDPVNQPVLGGGVVLKFSANQKYTTDGNTAAKVKLLAAKAGVTIQTFTNRSDVPGGSTLGNISGNQVPVPTADIGVAQLAMHSSWETCGCGDAEQLMKLTKQLFCQ